MTQSAPGRGPRSYAEAVLLGLLVHNLIAGAVCVAFGLPAAGDFLWAVGSGLALGYAIYWLSTEFRARRWNARVAVVTVLFAAMIAAVVVQEFLAGDLLGTLLIVAVQIRPRSRAG